MLIGLSGKIGTGKSAVAKVLEEHGFVRRSFADALREEVAEALDIPIEWTRDRKDQRMGGLPDPYPRHTMTLREILQWHGTDYRRAQDPLYWTAQLDAWLKAYLGQNVVVDDCRFPDEMDMLLARGGLSVRLLPYPSWEPGPNAGHVSETALDDYPRFHIIRRPGFGEIEAVAREILEAARARAMMGDLADG